MAHLFFKKIVPPLFICILSLSLSTISLAREQKETITFAFTEWKPVFYLDENKQMQGLYSEILTELLENRLNLKIESLNLPWKRCQLYINEGKADFTVMVPTDERAKYSLASDIPLYRFYLNAFTYKDHPKIAEIKTIKTASDIKKFNLHPVTNLGNDWHKYNIDNYGVDTIYIADVTLLFKYLSLKRADLVIDLKAPAVFYLQEQNLQDQIVMTDVQFGPLNMHLMMSKKSKFVNLIPAINETLLELWEEGYIDKLAEKYETIHEPTNKQKP